MRKQQKNRHSSPSFEGYKAVNAARRKRRDEPPHHSRRHRRSAHADTCYRRGFRWPFFAWAAAAEELDAAFGERNRAGAEFPHGKHGYLARKAPEVRIPVATV